MATHGMTSDNGPVDRLAEEFLDRHRRGERPTPDEYAALHPQWADEIFDIFPALLMMEQFKPMPEDLTGSFASGPAGLAGTSRRLGDYRILREVGRGGMGVVYEAVQESLGRHVALKVLPQNGRMDAGQLERFRLEARSAARLHHTNIVPVFDVGEHEGVHFYSMQFISGQGLDVILRDLRRLRDRGPGAEFVPTQAEALTHSVARAHGLLARSPTALDVAVGNAATQADTTPEDEARDVPEGSPSPAERSELIGPSEAGYFQSVARIGVRVADALAYAHSQGVLHRDIKPSNLLLDTAGQVWVADFGLAKLEGSDGPTAAGDVVGTLRYMAPERFQGRSDPKSDVYGLGATLYELLTLRAVFDDDDRLRLMDRIAREAPTPARRIDHLIPLDLEAIVQKALAKDPDDRFLTAADLRDDLTRFVQNRPTRTRPLTPPEQLWRWCKRNPLVAGLNVLAATLTIVIAVVSTIAAIRNGRLATEANRNLIQAYTSEAAARRVSRRVGQRFEALAAIEKAVRLASTVDVTATQRLRLRNEAIAALALPDLRVAKELEVSRALRNGFAMDPQFERFATKLDDGTVRVCRVADGAELVRLPGLPPAASHTSTQFSPDGRFLATTSGQQREVLQVWDVSERRLLLTDRELAESNPVNWSFRADSRELALCRSDGSIVFYELPSGRLFQRWTEYASSGWALAYSPDGSRLALLVGEGKVVQVVSRSEGRLVAALPQAAAVNHFVWNPRRPNLLAVACENNLIFIWDVDSGKQMLTLEGETYNGIVLAYHPGGELLASCGWHGVKRLWDTRSGRQILSRPSRWFYMLQIDTFGRWIIGDATAEKVRILELADAAECRTLVRDPFAENDRHFAPCIDPTGRRVAASGDNGTLATVWDLPSGTTLATLPVDGSHNIFFDSSGAVLTCRPALLRWPVGHAADGATVIGPPRMLQPEAGLNFSASRDGSTIGWPRGPSGGLVFDTADPTRKRHLKPLQSCDAVVLSPDGRWAVTGSHYVHEGMRLWDAQSGRLIHEFPGAPKEVGTVYCFSPDGRWLAVDSDGHALFETTNWTLHTRLSRVATGSLTFSPDSRVAVYDDNAESLIMADVESGRELARLEDPEQARARRTEFTPDGSSLVVTLVDRPYLRVWDLRAIRRRLAALRLDWTPTVQFGAPERSDPFPPIPKPFRVASGQLSSLWRQSDEEIVEQTTRALATNPQDTDARHKRGHALFSLARHEQAVSDFTAALEANADDAHLLAMRGAAHAYLGRLSAANSDWDAANSRGLESQYREWLAEICNGLAWSRVSGAATKRDPVPAIELAERAVDLAPKQASYVNTLGVALYRAARYGEAVRVLERSLSMRTDQSDARDLFVLAMARHRVGQTARARTDFDRAMRWLDAHPNFDLRELADLKSFRAEAKAVLARTPNDGP
jgi:serine/threonine protein kinase/WD40 repeat protein/Tfp pilus assembly protein PilF